MNADVIDPPTANVPAVLRSQKVSLLAKIADRYGVEPTKMMDTLKATAFKSSTPVSNEQMMALLIVADQYHLNPFTKELFAFPDKGGIVPVVSVDGWARIINEHPMFDGVEFLFDANEQAMTCVLHRKDRSHAISVTEYMAECKRDTAPWRSHPRRMLRHKALIQCARVAFGFAGIYDEDEAQRIVNMGHAEVVEPASASAARVRAVLAGQEPPAAEPAAPPAQQPKTYAQFADEALNAASADAAALVIDQARSTLPPDQYAELVDVYTNKWQPQE
jgi:phage recombination protein Bet